MPLHLVYSPHSLKSPVDDLLGSPTLEDYLSIHYALLLSTWFLCWGLPSSSLSFRFEDGLLLISHLTTTIFPATFPLFSSQVPILWEFEIRLLGDPQRSSSISWLLTYCRNFLTNHFFNFLLANCYIFSRISRRTWFFGTPPLTPCNVRCNILLIPS